MGTELDFQKHFEKALENIHGYRKYTNPDITDKEWYLIEDDLIAYIRKTQLYTYAGLEKNYGSDTNDEIIRALKEETNHRPLWMIFRNGLTVRGIHFNLFDRIPRSLESSENPANNIIGFIPQLEIGEEKRPDIVLFLNGLPIIVIELKHEKNQNVHDAVSQFVRRNHQDKIFRLPFLYIASDTTEVKAAANPSKEANFRWYNTGLVNQPENNDEYPVEYLYRHVLSRESILEILSFYLIYVPKIPAADGIREKEAFTIFPRYHQSRVVSALADDILDYYHEHSNCGNRYLINHSAGSGKTLTISWLADRLNSLYVPGTNKKIIDIVFILTDRKVLDKNVRDELGNFTHLNNKMKFAGKADDLPKYIKNREQIIVTTQQKITWIIEKLKSDSDLKTLNVALLIDEAHRSQGGKAGTNIRNLFKDDGLLVVEEVPDEEDEINNELKKAEFPNMMMVAFTATPSQSTIQLFDKPFDIYSEAEAIQEGYIVDVASSIISYKTLYNLESRIIPFKDEKTFPTGIISKMLKNIAYQDKGLIQYKAELMLRIFEENIYDLIDGKAKAMIVATSRIAGLEYYKVLKEKLKEKRKADPEKYGYDVLYAFSDFTNPETGKDITEQQINALSNGELIEDLFDTDKYRLLVVANKFQTGFDQPLLAGMFLDKPVSDRNAVQTVSRLNRCHDNKDHVVVVDFTNNADEIIKAFKKYREGTPFEPAEPNIMKLKSLYDEIISWNVFNMATARDSIEIIKSGSDANQRTLVRRLRTLFLGKIKDVEHQKEYISLLSKYNSTFVFLSNFFEIEEDFLTFAVFTAFIYPQLLKEGSESELKKIMRGIYVTKAAVSYTGEKKLEGKYSKKNNGGAGGNNKLQKVTVRDVIESIREKYKISEAEALVIKDVCEEKIHDQSINHIITTHIYDMDYLDNIYKRDVRKSIESSYMERSLYECLTDEKYIDPGSIFDIMSHTVIQVTIDDCA